MADLALRRPQNAPGAFYVDSSCIDCDTCRWMAPATFARRGGKSAVAAQPATPQERRAALHALVSCPTASIGTQEKAPDLAAASRDFPLPVAGSVLHCGYHAESSFGAASYLIVRPEGNVLVDCPRFAAPLVRRLEELGGVSHLVLTHRDDVAEHRRFAERFGLRRVLHEADAPVPGGPVEEFLSGTQPVEVVPGLTAIPTPGHTAGHVAYLWRQPEGDVLFSGDHCDWDEEAQRVAGWPEVCWFDWEEQVRSHRRLAEVPFEHLLPGHGRRVSLPPGAMQEALRRGASWMATAKA